MAKTSDPPTISDEQVKALLDRYHCPVPFHAVRTRFLGHIASPDVGSSPVKMLEALWGGELPPFDNLDAANELMGGLVMGLWNRLTRHQERSAPFRLTRLDVPATRDGLAKLAILRREELDGFVQGLFGDSETLDARIGLSRNWRKCVECSRPCVNWLWIPVSRPKPATSL